MYAIDFRSCIPLMHVYKVETAGEPPTVDKPTASICFRKTGSSGLYLSKYCKYECGYASNHGFESRKPLIMCLSIVLQHRY